MNPFMGTRPRKSRDASRPHNMRKSHFVGASPCTTTTPFDMVALDELVRFHLAIAAIERLPDRGGAAGEEAIQQFRQGLAAHRAYIVENGEGMPEIRDWMWPSRSNAGDGHGRQQR
ncbi:hypothetical protein LCGC14_0952530 [marine sediment metagenome]